jgi:hypothetical protein
MRRAEESDDEGDVRASERFDCALRPRCAAACDVWRSRKKIHSHTDSCKTILSEIEENKRYYIIIRNWGLCMREGMSSMMLREGSVTLSEARRRARSRNFVAATTLELNISSEN